MNNRSYTILKIKHNNINYEWCKYVCLQARYIYNVMLYEYRQNFFKTENERIDISFKDLYQIGKASKHWKELPAKCSSQCWMQLTNDINSYWKAIKEYNKNPEKFKKRPNIPNYNKDSGIVIFNIQTLLFSHKLPSQHCRLVRTDIVLDLSKYEGEVREVKIIPKKDYFIIKATFKQDIKEEELNENKVASIDIGVNNLAAITTNQAEIQHILINGRPLKSINQYYNKTKAKLQNKLPKGKYKSKRINNLTDKRNNKIDDYLHKASRYIVNLLVENNIGTLVIGKNRNWKQEINIGKANNQNFIMIPHARFIDLIKYKYESVGGKLILVNEAYTSKCSALDIEPIKKHDVYKGNRVKRGLFKSVNGVLINADINGSLNILRKVVKKEEYSALIDSQQWAKYSPIKISIK